MTRLHDGTILGEGVVTHLRRYQGPSEKIAFFSTFTILKGYSGFTDLIKNQSIGVA